MPDLPSAFYFSAVTYTTTGYGDLVLPQDWLLVGDVGAHGHPDVRLVDGFFFAIFTKVFDLNRGTRPAA